MARFWKKPFFWILCFVVFAISLPLLAVFYVYLFPAKQNNSPAPSSTNKPLTSTTTQTIQAGSCLILEEKYCSQAQVIDWTSPSGNKMKLIGFNLPSEISLAMPIDGQIAKVKLPEGSKNKGFDVQIFDPKNPTKWYIFIGDMQFDNMFSLNMKKGEVFGRTQKTGIENRGHQILFYIVSGSGKDAVVAEGELQKLFPKAKL